MVRFVRPTASGTKITNAQSSTFGPILHMVGQVAARNSVGHTINKHRSLYFFCTIEQKLLNLHLIKQQITL